MTKRRSARKNGSSSAAALIAAANAAAQNVDAEADVARGNFMPAEITLAIAEAALNSAVPKRLRKRLAGGKPIAIVISVPSPEWLEPMDSAARTLSAAALIITRDGAAKSKKAADGDSDVARALVYGRSVIGVSPAPERALPAALTSCADARFEIAPPNADIVRAILRRFVGGRVPRALPAQPFAGLSLVEIVSCFRRGASARDILADAARLAARKSGTSASDDTPPLDKFPGFSGAARKWGEDLVADFARWRAGEIPWQALSASAVLTGSPGTGKTLFAKALARSLGVVLHVTSVGSWFAHSDGNLGGVTQALQSAWDAAIADARAGGALLLIDEMDSLPDRATMDSRAREWWSSLVAHALTLFDGATTSRQGLVLLGATNFGARLDAALVRPGRFDRVIEIPLPSVEDLVEVLRFHLDGALAGVDLKPIVQLGSGATPAVAAGWARGAKARAAAARRDVEVDDLVSVVAPGDDRSDADVRRASVHEAGHFVVAADLGRRAEAVSIIVVGGSGGRTKVDTLATVFPTARDLDLAVIIALAGRAAEEVALGAPSVGAESDLAAATAALASAHASAGLGRSLVHVAPSQEAPGLVGADPALRRIVDRHLARLYLEAKRRVQLRLADVERVADALQRRRFLAGDELTALLAQPPGRSRRKKEISP